MKIYIISGALENRFFFFIERAQSNSYIKELKSYDSPDNTIQNATNNMQAGVSAIAASIATTIAIYLM